MPGYVPPRPTGSDAEARFYQAVWDTLWGGASRVSDVPSAKTLRTTRGVFTIPAPARAVGKGGGWQGPFEYDGTPGNWTTNDVVIISGPVNTGTYVCMVGSPTVDPWNGGPPGGPVEWIQLPGDKGAWT